MLTHDGSICALHATTVANIGRDASEGNGVLDTSISPWLQAAQYAEAIFFMNAAAQQTKLWA
jgi:hypothetical protein